MGYQAVPLMDRNLAGVRDVAEQKCTQCPCLLSLVGVARIGCSSLDF